VFSCSLDIIVNDFYYLFLWVQPLTNIHIFLRCVHIFLCCVHVDVYVSHWQYTFYFDCHKKWTLLHFAKYTRGPPHTNPESERNEVYYCMVSQHGFATFHTKRGPPHTTPESARKEIYGSSPRMKNYKLMWSHTIIVQTYFLFKPNFSFMSKEKHLYINKNREFYRNYNSCLYRLYILQFYVHGVNKIYIPL